MGERHLADVLRLVEFRAAAIISHAREAMYFGEQLVRYSDMDIETLRKTDVAWLNDETKARVLRALAAVALIEKIVAALQPVLDA